MSDTPQGPGWWQASDDKWYPPPRPAMPGEEPAAAAPGAAPYGAPPAGSPPVAPPVAPPTAPPPGSPAAFGVPPGPPSGGFPPGPPTAPGPVPPAAGGPSPYGMPPATPPAGEPNRTPLFIVLGILGAAAVVLLIFLIAGGEDEPKDDPPRNPSDRTTQPSNVDTTSPPDTDAPPPSSEGPLAVVDQGFSNFTDEIDNEPAGSFGFIVENTGDDILQGVDTQVVIYGEDDRVITTKDFSVGTIRPGEKLGFGDELYGEDVGSGIERLEIQIPEHADAAVNSSDVPEGGFEVSGISTRADDYNLTTAFTLTSTYSAEAVSYPSAYVIYRDADDKIVGAAWGGADLTSPTVQVEITTYDPIPDVETTEVYVDPGYIYVP